MIASRADLLTLYRRLMVRSVSGGALAALLLVQVLLMGVPGVADGLLDTLLAGLLLGVGAVVDVRRRIEKDLLAGRVFSDLLQFGLPTYAVVANLAALAQPAGLFSVTVLVARSVLSLQDAALIHRVHRALETAPSGGLPRLRRTARPAQPLPRSPDVMLLSVDSGGTPRCPVCGEDVVADEIRCADCQTPHHADCFRYNGACGMYACGGRPPSR